MNPNLCRVALRVRGPLEVFDLALAVMRVHSGVFLRLMALLVLPPALLCGALSYALDGHWALVAVPVALAPVLQAPATLLAGRLLFSDAVTVRDVVYELATRPGALLLPVLFSWGAIAFCVIAMPLAAFVAEAALLERATGFRVLSRSVRLVGYNPGIAFAVVGAFVGLTVWGAWVGEATGQALIGMVFQLGQPFGKLTNGHVTPYVLFGMLAVQPVLGVFRLLSFVDVRTRVDGWDLQVELRAAGMSAEDA